MGTGAVGRQEEGPAQGAEREHREPGAAREKVAAVQQKESEIRDRGGNQLQSLQTDGFGFLLQELGRHEGL